ncbi:MAG: sigma 54-interacting transcriptional regulator [bacterium]
MAPTENQNFLKRADIFSVIENMPLGVALLDRELRVVAMNSALEALTGFSVEESRFLPLHYVLRDNLCVKECPAARALQSGRMIYEEGDIITRWREKLPVRISASPLKDGSGGVLGAVQTLEDLSLKEDRSAKIPSSTEYGELVGHSSAMQKIYEVLPVLAYTDSSVLITGETGTGKDLLAAVIHQMSSRSQGPFIKVNCGALPENLLESELFGHVKGAFTGAVRDKPGRFQLAESGTIYLTEVGDLQLPLQVKLLSFLDDREIIPVGGTRSVKTDVRIIAATHRDLEAMVKEGAFREDLLYRLKVVRIDLPPVRDRGDDLRLLLEHYFHYFQSRLGKNLEGFSDEALALLKSYPYPGNVRELKNMVEYAVSICPSGEIRPEHLPEYMVGYRRGDEAVKLESPPSEVREKPLAGDAVDTGLNWEQMERRMIAEALLKCGGNRSRAAEMLGWGRSTLWRKMKKHGL